jgi:hypothetical protein
VEEEADKLFCEVLAWVERKFRPAKDFSKANPRLNK